MAYDLEEQEKIDQIKNWWQQHGARITLGVTLGALAIIGWRVWDWYQNQRAEEAGILYSTLQRSRNPKEVRSIATELQQKYGGTTYAQLGALVAARASFDEGDAKNAREHLAWAVRHSTGELRDTARLRLAGVLLDEKAYDEALAELAQKPSPPFVAAYTELKGDILLAQEKPEEARAAYREALSLLVETARKDAAERPETPGTPAPVIDAETLEGPLAETLRLKLEVLGGA
ncbi:MAG: tetratricopeptide repeat protein [Zoogloeaceae bacterium]|jgi:predicted negative regulator of RcsB-dependent stress response|nr:tetratricopeptide repeat protein [Zoogloeaceae bacterium]